MPTTITFTEPGEFAATRAAEQWCAERGISVGRLQAHAPRGLLFGDYDIQKWRNLRRDERAALHGTMVAASFRNGPVTVRLTVDLDPAVDGNEHRVVV